MGRSAVLKGIHQKSELFLCPFFGEAQHGEHLLLQGAVVDTDRPATNFHAVDHHVIGIGPHCPRIRIEQGDILRFGRGERVMFREVAVQFLVLLQEGEVHHPEAFVVVFVSQSEARSHLQAQFGELFLCFLRLPRQHQDQVSRFGVALFGPLFQGLFVVELIHRRLECSVPVVAEVYESFGTNLWPFHEVGQLVQLFARIGGTPFGTDGTHIFGGVEHHKVVPRGQLLHFGEGHPEARIRLVRPVEAHGIGVADAGKVRDLDSLYCFEEMLCEPFKGIQHILLFHERHFAVNLRELRLAVGPQVLVAKTLHDLEVSVETRYHQQLFEELGRLWQGVELALVHARGDNEVACPFGRGADQHRRLHLQESPLVEVSSSLERHPVTQLQVLAHHVASQVQVSVFHPQLVASVRFRFDGEGRCLGCIQYSQFGDDDFDVAGRDVRILAGAFLHGSRDLYHPLAAQFVSLFAKLVIHLLVERQLCDAIAVSQVDERHAAHLPDFGYPAGQGHLSVCIGQPQFAARTVSIHMISVYFAFLVVQMYIILALYGCLHKKRQEDLRLSE